MKKLRTFEKIHRWQPDKVAYSILFKRFNGITFFTGLLLMLLAVINIPLLYNPELGEITFELIGKPVFGPMAALNFYLFVGLLPAILGLVILFFSIFSSRKVIMFMNNDGTCQYRKFWAPKPLKASTYKDFMIYSRADFSLKENIQNINLGKRHHRFVIWAPVAGIILLIFLLFDHLNFLDPTFDVMVDYFDTEYSTKFLIWINVFYLIGIMIPITLFPRKLCKIDTSEEFIEFDYSKIYIEKHSDSVDDIPYVKPFIMLSKGQRIEEVKQSSIPDHYPDILKAQINKKDFKHLPLFILITNIGLFLLVFLPQLIPNFFLGGFTLKIEYFLMIAAFYFTIRTLHNNWYSGQKIESINNNLLVKRKNRIFGDSVEYFANMEKVEQDYIPRKPHYLEYALYLLPMVQIVWWFTYIFSFPVYFFTQNIYTILYFIVIIGIFLFTATEYILPRSVLSVTPKAQSDTRKKIEKYAIYFPSTQVLKKLPLKEARKNKQFFKNSLTGFLLILVPIIIGIVWVILSILEILPHITETVF
jgi:hypothetical protein